MILNVAGVYFQYPSRPVLRGVSFDLGKSQTLGVLGINGAGKSTLLKCLNRILRPKNGDILLNGKSLLKMNGNQIARRMGYVPQKYGEEKLTVYDTVLLGRKTVHPLGCRGERFPGSRKNPAPPAPRRFCHAAGP